MLTNRFTTMAVMLAAEALLLATAGPAHAQSAAAPNEDAQRTKGFLTTLNPGWEQFFKLDWAPATRHGKTRIEGHILNEWIFSAARVRLLVDALDASGNVVGQRLVWLLPPELTPGTRGYFDLPIPAPAVNYRVSVYSFDWKRSGA
jgi:hypothetical protein